LENALSSKRISLFLEKKQQNEVIFTEKESESDRNIGSEKVEKIDSKIRLRKKRDNLMLLMDDSSKNFVENMIICSFL